MLKKTEPDHQQPSFQVKDLKALAFSLLDGMKNHDRKISGFGKLKKKVLNELQHLQTLEHTLTFPSSNLFYLAAIWDVVVNGGSAVCGISKKFQYIKDNAMSSVMVDVVCNGGTRWVKVKASNPHSMQMEFFGAKKGKSIVSVADNLLHAAAQYPVYFRPPTVHFVCSRGITSDLAAILQLRGVVVIGQIIESDLLFVNDADAEDDDDDSKDAESQSPTETVDNDGLDESTVNVGVRTLLTMVSSLSNHEINDDFYADLGDALYQKQVVLISEWPQNKPTPPTAKPNTTTLETDEENPLHFRYCDVPQMRVPMDSDNGNNLSAKGFTVGHIPALKLSEENRRKTFDQKSHEELKMLHQMYLDEMKTPVLPDLLPLVAGKKIICCVSAWNRFMEIVNLSAGDREWRRCLDLQRRVTIVPDEESPRCERMKGRSVSAVNLAVFGTGDSRKVLTVSGTASFLRKAEQKGLKFHAVVHAVRPLMERYQMQYARKRSRDRPSAPRSKPLSAIEEVAPSTEQEEAEMEVIEDDVDETEVLEFQEMGSLTIIDDSHF